MPKAKCRYCDPDRYDHVYLVDDWDLRIYVDVESKQLKIIPKVGRHKTISITRCPRCDRKL